METKIDEIAAAIYRLSTWIPDVAPPAGFTFNLASWGANPTQRAGS